MFAMIFVILHKFNLSYLKLCDGWQCKRSWANTWVTIPNSNKNSLILLEQKLEWFGSSLLSQAFVYWCFSAIRMENLFILIGFHKRNWILFDRKGVCFANFDGPWMIWITVDCLNNKLFGWLTENFLECSYLEWESDYKLLTD